MKSVNQIERELEDARENREFWATRNPKSEYRRWVRRVESLEAQFKRAAEREWNKIKANPRRKNPTKAQKRVKARNTARKRGIVQAVKQLLQKTNPAARITGASMVKLKGGTLKITPIKANRGRC